MILWLKLKSPSVSIYVTRLGGDTFSGAAAAGVKSTMGTAGSQDKQTNGSVGKGNLYRSNGSTSQPSHPNGNTAALNASLSYELRPYRETDALLPNEHYQGSKFSGDTESKAPGGCSPRDGPAESLCSMVLQILVPFLLAGLGTVCAGMLLDFVQHWDVFQEITEIFILVPAVLGLKGNLEMTMASRLSTAVNAGKMEPAREKWRLVIGNLALKQLQATVLGLLAALMATALGWMMEGEMLLNHATLLCAASIATAFMASLLQGVIMVGVIIGSKKVGFNPDNVATPMAASFGDLITLAFLACFSQWFYTFLELYSYVLYLVGLVFVSLIPLWVVVSSKHPASCILLRTGWEPIITAMIITHTCVSVGYQIGCMGAHFDVFIHTPGLLHLSLLISGIGGNLVSIQSSRIATDLHVNCSAGEVSEDHNSCSSPCRTFCGSGANHRSARVLLLLVIPGQLIFIHAIHLLKGSHTLPSPVFIVAFLSAALIQVFSLLCIADWMVHCLWRRGKDPDSYSIPYLTALADLLGTGLLSLVFLLLWCIGDRGST
uniref:Solute carrier family 41 member n=1 Tax=Myripristis murdjan TaxID=586833 RepID=A0A667XQQ6_9TELE